MDFLMIKLRLIASLYPLLLEALATTVGGSRRLRCRWLSCWR